MYKLAYHIFSNVLKLKISKKFELLVLVVILKSTVGNSKKSVIIYSIPQSIISTFL
jgi:hypothetical protein